MSTFYESQNDYRSYLMHYGVKGMKWRRHKATPYEDARERFRTPSTGASLARTRRKNPYGSLTEYASSNHQKSSSSNGSAYRGIRTSIERDRMRQHEQDRHDRDMREEQNRRRGESDRLQRNWAERRAHDQYEARRRSDHNRAGAERDNSYQQHRDEEHIRSRHRKNARVNKKPKFSHTSRRLMK